MKALRTIRLDASDTFVFETSAAPGEWAVSGAFVLARLDPTTLTGKARAAFRAGILGIESFGWSTLVQVVDVTAAQRARAVDVLARRLLERCGAPGLHAARAAAEEEIDFASSLAQHPSGMLVAVARRMDAGAIKEAFRSLRAAEHKLPSAYAFLHAAGDEEAASEEMDLVKLAKRAAP